MSNDILELCNIKKSYGNVDILKDISFTVKKNEFLTLLGPSGCGKTTTLRIIGGFEYADGGQLVFNGESINSIPPYKRNINTVFQKYALFNHMNIYENIAFGLKLKKLKKSVIDEKVSQMLKMVNLEGFEKRKVSSLSGGQQQRIAIARALVNEPQVLLLDEPLGALDLKLRKEMQRELKNMQQQLGITFIYVTHDQEEALTMSDKIIVMDRGEIQQMGSPVDIYNEPNNSFVARFIGESNIVKGHMEKDYKVNFSKVDFKCVDPIPNGVRDVLVVVRPEDIKIVPAEKGMIRAKVQSVTFKGVHYELIAKEEQSQTDWLIHTTMYVGEDSVIGLNIFENDIHIMEGDEL
ncbi:spermidine/putrescine transport system ATP-binding protein [Hathewaya proteolytica DSM 3090]|uniref:Spermidine/putrescine import ATP-binding protein PotA n=1 Tax=Hathewaya proteolytica DSM 3090 TaxID=1121331 RepID=A0A1M6J229_9CLOT|nr:ABC transporter ATP-binding protein [Hathewaya proteolytica]SHJ40770.1 spermidine/putrescine transport system ATP-binding protein [Hathewaya proteolytica DSM 3090]